MQKHFQILKRNFSRVNFSLKNKITTPNSSNLIDLNPPKGARDFYPSDMIFRNYLFDQFKHISARYGYEEYDSSVLEHEDLYTVKSGSEIGEQLFNFEDKGGRKVTLRPEMTPSLARMIVSKYVKSSTENSNNAAAGIYPLKWFSIPQCWRYEKTSRGRRREHYQWNVDLWGVEGVEAEAEVLSMLISVFKRFGLTSKDVGIKVFKRIFIFI
jgi:histidyl-tRNA synthetase